MNRPTTEEEIKAHCERHITLIRQVAAREGFPFPIELERLVRLSFYLGAEAFLSEVAKIRFLAPGDQAAQWKRLCDVCAEGVKP